MKGGGKGMTKGGFKGYDKGGGVKGGFKGDEEKVAALKVSGKKIIGRKEDEKAAVTRGRVFKCGNVGHKAAEFMVHTVGEMGIESEKPIGEVNMRDGWWQERRRFRTFGREKECR